MPNAATRPYPTHQAITAPPSSLHRGDWGLKRPLPSRATTRTTTPAVKLRELDTIEHVTDFDSAADHTRTLAKWQELDLALGDRLTTTRYMRDLSEKAKGIFDDSSDKTTRVASETSLRNLRRQMGADGRWRRGGPWLPGMSAPDFAKWTEAIRGRSPAFNEFLREHVKKAELSAKRRDAQASGEEFTKDDEAKFRVTDEQFEDHVAKLRSEMKKPVSDVTELGRLIIEFFDLPPMDMESEYSGLPNSDDAALKVPRTTHPSAGLSYLRSNAYLENHPILGPRASKSPVEARVLKARTLLRVGARLRAQLGVAGIVTEDDPAFSSKMSRRSLVDEDAVDRFDPNIEGGKKVWVNPEYACVGWDGRIQMRLKRADEDAVAIRQGKVPGLELPPVTPAPYAARPLLDERLDAKPDNEGDLPRTAIERDMLRMVREGAQQSAQQ